MYAERRGCYCLVDGLARQGGTYLTRSTHDEIGDSTEHAYSAYAMRFVSDAPIDDIKSNGAAASRSSHEWQRGESPLCELDDAIFAFAADHRLVVRHNRGNRPSRTLEWTDGIHRTIQVHLEDEAALTYTLSICATQDRKHERFFKALALRESVPLKAIRRELEQLLDAGYRLLQAWTTTDLEFSINLPNDASSGWDRNPPPRTKPWQTGRFNS